MLSAKEAREISNECSEDKFQREIQGIFEQIKKVAECGEYVVHFNKYISKRAKEILQEQGFKLTYHTQYNEATTTVRW